MAVLTGLGYRAVPYDPEQLRSGEEAAERQLLRAMAVAGFAAGNIMLLSVSVWAGDFQGMGAATRALLHWFSALIALPAVVYAGRPFFASAWEALRHRRDQHGRADRGRHHAGLRDEPVRDGARAASTPISIPR